MAALGFDRFAVAGHDRPCELVVAIDQVLAFERRVRRLTGDAELARARDRFDAVGPDPEALRDLVAHLDAYAVGEGKRQRGEGKPPAITEKYLTALIWWGDGEGTRLNLGEEQLNLRTAAGAAVELARVVERVRAEHLKRAEQEANAALRRQYGLGRTRPLNRAAPARRRARARSSPAGCAQAFQGDRRTLGPRGDC